jgi:hypothetical protein
MNIGPESGVLVREEKFCHDCNKDAVCRILAGFSQIMGDFKTKVPPVEPDRLAEVCEIYQHRDKPTVFKVEMDIPEPTVELLPSTP